MFKGIKRSLIMAVMGAFLLVLPVVAAQTPAITSLQMDRTTVPQGQSITFSVRTTNANYVFAVVDGARTQGIRINTDAAGNHNWQVTVNPTRTTNVVIFANATNVEHGSASMSIPVTVTGTVANPNNPTTPVNPGTTPGLPVIPLPPTIGDVSNLGPVGIANLRETPAIAQGEVRLTLNTGPEAAYVWVRFDGNRYAQGTLISHSPAGYRTWTIDFRPRTWSTQLVQVGSNRSWNYTGASIQQLQLTLAQPFVPPTDPEIRNVVITPAQVNPGGRTTIRVTTNQHVNAVWMRDVDGWEVSARSIAPNNATTRTWEITFNPQRTGTVTIYANTSRQALGAVSRQESITVRGQNVDILHAQATNIGGTSNETRVRVTTNRYAESVWVITNNRTIHLNLVRGGTGNREWEAVIEGAALPMQVRASASRNHIGVDAEFTIRNWDGNWNDEWWWNNQWGTEEIGRAHV